MININDIVKVKYKNDNLCYDTYYIMAYIIDVCNLSCSYCYNAKNRTYSKLDLHYLYQYVLNIKSLTKKNIVLQIIGGESTLHPDLYDFCKKMNEIKDIEIVIYSNGSQTIEYYSNLLNINCVNVDFSYHSINNLINKSFIIKIAKLNSYEKFKDRFTVTIMAEQNLNLKLVLNLCQQLKIEKSKIDISLIYINGKQLKYSDDMLQFIFKNKIVYDEIEIIDKYGKSMTIDPSFIDKYRFSDFIGWKCNAGKTTNYIHVNGNIYNCQAEYVENKHHKSNIYSIKSTNLISNKMTICTCKYCMCDQSYLKFK